MPNLIETQYWDLKYYYWVHCQRQKLQWLHPVTYQAFCRRLDKMTLHDAIYMPRVEYNVRYRKKTPIQDEIRRKQINKYENIPVLDFEAIDKVLFTKREPMINTIQMPKPKKTLLQRFISLFKKPWQKKES